MINLLDQPLDQPLELMTAQELLVGISQNAIIRRLKDGAPISQAIDDVTSKITAIAHQQTGTEIMRELVEVYLSVVIEEAQSSFTLPHSHVE